MKTKEKQREYNRRYREKNLGANQKRKTGPRVTDTQLQALTS